MVIVIKKKKRRKEVKQVASIIKKKKKKRGGKVIHLLYWLLHFTTLPIYKLKIQRKTCFQLSNKEKIEKWLN